MTWKTWLLVYTDAPDDRDWMLVLDVTGMPTPKVGENVCPHDDCDFLEVSLVNHCCKSKYTIVTLEPHPRFNKDDVDWLKHNGWIQWSDAAMIEKEPRP